MHTFKPIVDIRHKWDVLHTGDKSVIICHSVGIAILWTLVTMGQLIVDICHIANNCGHCSQLEQNKMQTMVFSKEDIQ